MYYDPSLSLIERAVRAKMENKHKIFISYHHHNDQWYKEELTKLGNQHEIFIDQSVHTGDISDDLDDDAIRRKIRDEYLRDSSVTILLVGKETRQRKHVDWEIFSSMIDGKINKKSGILVVNLPGVENNSSTIHASHEGEKGNIYPEYSNWISVNSREEYERRHPYMPGRIIDNLMEPNAKVSVTNWSKIASNPNALRFLIEVTFNARRECKYNLSRPMRRRNS